MHTLLESRVKCIVTITVLIKVVHPHPVKLSDKKEPVEAGHTDFTFLATTLYPASPLDHFRLPNRFGAVMYQIDLLFTIGAAWELSIMSHRYMIRRLTCSVYTGRF